MSNCKHEEVEDAYDKIYCKQCEDALDADEINKIIGRAKELESRSVIDKSEIDELLERLIKDSITHEKLMNKIEKLNKPRTWTDELITISCLALGWLMGTAIVRVIYEQ